MAPQCGFLADRQAVPRALTRGEGLMLAGLLLRVDAQECRGPRRQGSREAAVGTSDSSEGGYSRSLHKV